MSKRFPNGCKVSKYTSIVCNCGCKEIQLLKEQVSRQETTKLNNKKKKECTKPRSSYMSNEELDEVLRDEAKARGKTDSIQKSTSPTTTLPLTSKLPTRTKDRLLAQITELCSRHGEVTVKLMTTRGEPSHLWFMSWKGTTLQGHWEKLLEVPIS